MGTQKNRLNETFLLSTQKICSNRWIRKDLKSYAQKMYFIQAFVKPFIMVNSANSFHSVHNRWNHSVKAVLLLIKLNRLTDFEGRWWEADNEAFGLTKLRC